MLKEGRKKLQFRFGHYEFQMPVEQPHGMSNMWLGGYENPEESPCLKVKLWDFSNLQIVFKSHNNRWNHLKVFLGDRKRVKNKEQNLRQFVIATEKPVKETDNNLSGKERGKSEEWSVTIK